MAVKEFGISINFKDGSTTNIDNLNDKLILLKEKETYDGVYSVYKNNGVWTSKVIDLVDKYTDLGNLAINNVIYTGQSFKAYTRTSEDSLAWDDYVEIDYVTGKMKSTPKRYIQIKIELSGNKTDYKEKALEFKSTDINRFVENKFITTQNNILELKKNYSFNMTTDNSDNIYKTTISSGKFKKIDKIRLSMNGVEI